MFWKKKDIGRVFHVNTEVYPEMMMVPFLFGAWLIDAEWQAMYASIGKYTGPPSAILFFGNHMMVRFFIIDDQDENGNPIKRHAVTQYMYQTRDGGIMDKQRALQEDGETRWSEPYEFKWWMTQDLGLMLEKPEVTFERFKPSSLKAVFDAGFPQAAIERLIADYRAAGVGFIETFTEKRANAFIDARFEAELDGRERPSPPVS